MAIYSLTMENAEHKKYNIIAVFHNKDKHYLAYTDGSKKDTTLDILVARYDSIGENINIYDVPTKEEWEFIDNYIATNIFGGEDND